MNTLSNSQIPKIIHYCWFGKKNLPPLAIKCINSWKKFCPDYQIIRWDESNFNINDNLYVKQAYKNKKYAFVSDYVRLYALYNYGGVYMDADVEVIKNLDTFLNCSFFSGFESTKIVPTGIIGSEIRNTLTGSLLSIYDKLNFKLSNGQLDLMPNTCRLTPIITQQTGLLLNGQTQYLQKDIHIYAQDYFCPDRFPELKITSNTATIHWFAGSWLPTRKKLSAKSDYMIKTFILRIIGAESYKKIKTLYHHWNTINMHDIKGKNR